MNTPVVVIIGRPNVGKSTLFNRLVGKKDAIVDDVSGVTRDRNYGEVEWAGKEFRLIDTGGYVPDSENIFENEIREQVKIGISESDIIIFLVDGRDGITPMDTEIAKLLRSSSKKSFLVVNKIDNEKLDNHALEFYELGLGEPYQLSALVGRNIGDFLDLITSEFESFQTDEKDTRLKITIVGKPNVGKSSLTNALLGVERSIVTDIPGTTRDSLNSVLKFYGEEIVLIDTAGLRKKSKVSENIEYYSTIRTLKSIAECDVTILLVDAQDGLQNQDQKIIDEALRRRKGLIIAINKWDLIEKDTNTAAKFEKEVIGKLGSIDYVPVIFISALTKQRIFKLITLAKEIQTERSKKIPTNELNEYILEVIKTIPPPTTHTGKEVRIKYVTQVGDYYPIFLFFCNYPKHVSDSYRRFLEKQIREKFGFKGVPFTLSFREK